MGIKAFLPACVRRFAKKSFYFLWQKSLERAAGEQMLSRLAKELESIVPDIRDQYSSFTLDDALYTAKTRNQHAFQISLVNEIIGEFEKPVIVDIGDSSGTHLRYITGLYAHDKNIRCMSVNVDEKAVEKIKQKGLEAIHARAENLQDYNVNADIFLCFETLEHLMDPCHFLHDLSARTNAKYLVATVPYVRRSRVGLHYIRWNMSEYACAERAHIFELSPEEWKLVAQHSGWGVVKERIYLQYPKKGPLRVTKPLWKRFDFEGFYGMVLKKDTTYSSQYKDW